MNNIISSTLAAALVLVATSTFAQGATAAHMGKGHGIHQNNSGGGIPSPSGPNGRTTLAGLPQHSPTGHEYNQPVNQGINRCDVRHYTQDRYVAIATVVPSGLHNRITPERNLRASAPTKAAAASRMRQLIDDIGVPVDIIRYQIVRQ